MSSSDNLHAKVLEFLVEEFKRPGMRQCIRLELAHAQPGFRADQITAWEREDDPGLFEDLTRIEQLTATIIKRAEEEADSFGTGTHRFVVKTTQQIGATGRCSFQLAASFVSGGDDETALVPAGQAGATRRGGGENDLLPALSLQMRHNERLMNINGQMFQGSLAVLAKTNEGLREENARLAATVADLTTQLHAANDRKDERDMAAMKQIAADQRKEKVIAKVLPFIPIAASRLIAGSKGKDGKDGGGSPETALQILAGELSKSLTPAQIARVAQPLSTEQKVLFMELMRVVQMNAPPDDAPAPQNNEAKNEQTTEQSTTQPKVG